MVGERRHSALRSALILTIGILLAAEMAWAGGGPRDVAIVININSAASVEIGQYYQSVRGIPDSNVCRISCPEDEVVPWTVCESQIREPIRRFLQRPEVAGRISYIVLTKGIPLAADYVDGILDGNVDDYRSVASFLVDLETPVVDITGPGGVPDGLPDNAGALSNPYGPTAMGGWGFTAPVKAWRYDLFDSGDQYDINKRFYLVTRLDGFTVAQVKSIIDRSVSPAPDGRFVLDRNTWNYGAYKTANYRLGDLMNSAYDHLVRQGREVLFDAGSDFLCQQQGLMGYFSWASNDHLYTFAKYTSNIFVPGSIADTYYSYSGRTFNDPGTTNRSPLIADLFACGLCGAGGYVSEPMITTATYPNVLFSRYTTGYNMAESFYAACPNLKWKSVFVGDPLMAPYATPPEVSIDLESSFLSDVVDIPVTANDEVGVSKVVFYLGNQVIGEDSSPPFSIQLDTKEYPIGVHVLEVVAYENSDVATQGSAKRQVIIDNPVSAVSKIADTFDYADGQYVRLRSKVVTAATADIRDGFYVQESDRSSGIKVLTTQVVNRGDVVTITGPMCTDNGSRAVIGAVINVESSGAPIPGPLMLRLRDLGGAGRPGLIPPVGAGIGARNTSLLVKVVGRVTASQTGELYITDGSTAEPVRIVCPGLDELDLGTMVAVTGISAAESDGGRWLPCILARDPEDVQIL